MAVACLNIFPNLHLNPIFSRMSDSFFQSDKKRKRTRDRRPTSKLKFGRKAAASNSRPKPRDEDLSESGDEAVDLDTIDFRAGRQEAGLNDHEYVDEYETGAEKRVRLAKGYLAKVRDELEAGETFGSSVMKLTLLSG